jgi:hypothetical protein
MPKKRNKQYYGNLINLRGLYSRKPIVCSRKDERGIYWDKSGDFNIDPKKLGLSIEQNGDLIQFASENRLDVELWTSGAMAALGRIKEYCEIES